MAAVYREHEFDLDQGDILADVPFLYRRADRDVEVVARRGLVTSHGCDCERYERQIDDADDTFRQGYSVQVAPVLMADEFDQGGLLGDIRSGRVPQYFAIPAEEPVPEFVVDLHQEQPIPVALLLECQRERSLSDDMWKRLVVHKFRLSSRFKPEKTAFVREFLDEA